MIQPITFTTPTNAANAATTEFYRLTYKGLMIIIRNGPEIKEFEKNAKEWIKKNAGEYVEKAKTIEKETGVHIDTGDSSEIEFDYKFFEYDRKLILVATASDGGRAERRIYYVNYNKSGDYKLSQDVPAKARDGMRPLIYKP